jgi:CHAT domain-containing protein
VQLALARTFFYVGAASLLVSQWSVADVATRVLMTEVFRRQAQVPSLLRAEALRQGMLAVMTKAQGKTAYFVHPYAWAPFVLVGEGDCGRPWESREDKLSRGMRLISFSGR